MRVERLISQEIRRLPSTVKESGHMVPATLQLTRSTILNSASFSTLLAWIDMLLAELMSLAEIESPSHEIWALSSKGICNREIYKVAPDTAADNVQTDGGTSPR